MRNSACYYRAATAGRLAVRRKCGWVLWLVGVLLASVGPTWAQSGGAANLDQTRNGAYGSPLDPPSWVNGNAGAQNAHYLEGHSIGYRLVLSNLAAGAHTVVIGWDVRDGGKHALDYLTHYQNLLPHSQFGHAAETLDPLSGLGLGGASVSTAAIPAPAQIPTGLPFSYYQLQAAGREMMTLFNGTSLDNLSYVVQGDRTLAHAETQLAITFHTTQPTVVLAWGGHIASQLDWGAGTSAVNINGSPYHTRLISLDGSGGNQDRSLSASAIAQPPTCAFSGPSVGCAGQALTFTGPAGMSSYSWTVTGVGASPSTAASQSITVTAAADYTVQLVTTKAGVSSDGDCQQTVTINAITTATALADLTRCPGEAAAFTTAASGTGPLTYAWTKNGVPLTGATGPDYNIASVSAGDAGTYAVTVAGTCGTVTRTAILTVDEVTTATTLADQTRCPGETATFTTSASGTGPFIYTWTKDGMPLAGASGPTYTVAAASAADAGTYAVTVSGACTSVVRSATLTVNEATATAALANQTRCPGEAITLATTASGTGPFTYAWVKDGNVIAGATGPTYTIGAVTAADAGTYSVAVSGARGTAASSATLTVNENTAATDLASLTRCPGEAATFTVTASGTGPFYYIWDKDGVTLPAATGPSYSVPAATAADAGTYTVTVIGSCNKVSRSATLQVNETTATTNLSNLTRCSGEAVAFTTTTTGTGPFTYTWTKDGVPLAGASGPRYAIASLTLADAGTYAVTVTGACNAVTQTASLTVNSCLAQHCTLTQGGYGNANGVLCKYPTWRRTQLIAGFLTDADVVLGAPGRSLTYARTAGTSPAALAARLATAQCIIDRLPAGGPAGAFPAFGDVSGCGPLPASLLKNGKFNNVLVGQALTLALNLRVDPSLGGVTLAASMTSYNALNCNGSDPADLTGLTRTIPASVLGNLSYLGGTATVTTLLGLANKALGGVAYANAGGSPSVADISSAAAAVNELFDNCRMYRSPALQPEPLSQTPPAGRPSLGLATPAEALLTEALQAYPNPFRTSTTLAFALPQSTPYQLLVIDPTGREVARLGSGNAQAGVRYTFTLSGLAEGMYVARLLTETGQQTVHLSLIH